jgi:hypothetical protein
MTKMLMKGVHQAKCLTYFSAEIYTAVIYIYMVLVRLVTNISSQNQLAIIENISQRCEENSLVWI